MVDINPNHFTLTEVAISFFKNKLIIGAKKITANPINIGKSPAIPPACPSFGGKNALAKVIAKALTTQGTIAARLPYQNALNEIPRIEANAEKTPI